MPRNSNPYSDTTGRQILPAIMDGLTALVLTAPLWLAWEATTGRSLSTIEVTVTAGVNFAITALTSWLTIRYQLAPPYARPRHRSAGLTAIAVGAMIGAIVIFTMLADGDFSLAGAWKAFATTSLVGVPAALRMTAPAPPPPQGDSYSGDPTPRWPHREP